jgi:putative aldouronate transport system permease protein
MKISANKRNDFIFHFCNYILLVGFALICFYPFYYIFIYSISDPIEVAVKGVFFLPVRISFQNFENLFNKTDVIFNAAFVSAARAVVGTVLTVLCTSFFAFLVSKPEMPLRRLVYRFTVLTMYIGAGLIPWYVTMKNLGLKNSFLLYVLPSAIGAFYVVLVKTYIEQIPAALEESAKLDGAGHMTVFARIIFPICKPIIATIAIFSAVAQWNSWQDNLFLVSTKNLQTLQLVLYNFLNTFTSSSVSGNLSQLVNATSVNTTMSLKMAICMITVLPIIVVYPAMQKYFVKGIMLGAVKG